MLIHIYEDPAHGWAKVSKKLLRKLSIEDKISPFSYEQGAFAYLEEDCDLGVLIHALNHENIGYKFKTHHTNNESRIRGFDHYGKRG